jgi:hypothetical protein
VQRLVHRARDIIIISLLYTDTFSWCVGRVGVRDALVHPFSPRAENKNIKYIYINKRNPCRPAAATVFSRRVFVSFHFTPPHTCSLAVLYHSSCSCLIRARTHQRRCIRVRCSVLQRRRRQCYEEWKKKKKRTPIIITGLFFHRLCVTTSSLTIISTTVRRKHVCAAPELIDFKSPKSHCALRTRDARCDKEEKEEKGVALVVNYIAFPSWRGVVSIKNAYFSTSLRSRWTGDTCWHFIEQKKRKKKKPK